MLHSALAPFEKSNDGSSIQKNAFQLQQDLQETMQDKVGIVRNERDMQDALTRIDKLKKQAGQVAVFGHREYNPGWHTAIDLHSLLTVAEAVTRTALDRRESRGAHFRDDFPEKIHEFAKVNIVVKKGDDGQMKVHRQPLVEMTQEQEGIIEEMK